jgi:polysaccharide deacetylase 2 family uncharacterized protein YibQ
MSTRRRRSRRGWSFSRLRRRLRHHKTSIVRASFGAAFLGAFWLLWPGPERVAVDHRSVADRRLDEPASANVDGLVSAAQASIAVAGKGQLVGEATAVGQRLERTPHAVAGTMPAIGLPDPLAHDGTTVLPGLDGPAPETAAPVEMAARVTGDSPSEPAAALSAPMPPPPAPPRAFEAMPDAPASASPRTIDPAPPLAAADGAEPADTAAMPEPRVFEESAVPVVVPHAAGSAAPEPAPPDAGAPAETAAHAVAPIRLVPGRAPTWLQNAVAPVIDERPAIAIVIDDLGVNRAGTAALNRLRAPLTLAFLPYASGVGEQARAARAAGHELLVHVPMEPRGTEWPGPDALTSQLGPADLVSRLRTHLRSFEGFVGVNNHMGSRLTENPERMDLLMTELRQRDLLFLDSRTTPRTVAGRVARRLEVPYAERDVFLDNELEVDAVLRQLQRAENIARRKGYAVAMGHPHDVTIEALRRWLPTLEARGFALAPISAIVARRSCLEGAPLIDEVCARYTAVAGLQQ